MKIEISDESACLILNALVDKNTQTEKQNDFLTQKIASLEKDMASKTLNHTTNFQNYQNALREIHNVRTELQETEVARKRWMNSALRFEKKLTRLERKYKNARR